MTLIVEHVIYPDVMCVEENGLPHFNAESYLKLFTQEQSVKSGIQV
jgi:hypothetical protein